MYLVFIIDPFNIYIMKTHASKKQLDSLTKKTSIATIEVFYCILLLLQRCYSRFDPADGFD